MAILLSYYYQLKFYDTILEEMAVEDTGPLSFLTSDGRVTLSDTDNAEERIDHDGYVDSNSADEDQETRGEASVQHHCGE